MGARGRASIELADTSAWTSRHLDKRVEDAFNQRLAEGGIATCGPVRMELLLTARDAEEFAAQRDALDALTQLPAGPPEWARAEEVFLALARLGPLHHRQVKIADLVIAAVAETAGVPVLHYDRHFDLIASMTGQPVRAIAPLGSL